MTVPGPAPGLATDWQERLSAGDRITLARVITAIENARTGIDDVLAAIAKLPGHAQVVGFTGAPGVGKSTLLSGYVSVLRERGKRVGVVAVDPSSPLTGGAVLGDRIRLGKHGTDQGVFVRSLASRGHLGGLSRATDGVIAAMRAAGIEVIVLETVGTGQSEIEVAQVATTKVVVCAPGLGDEIQALKAGVLEIADVLVVNKGDLPAAERAVGDLQHAAARRARPGQWQVPVLCTTATSSLGLHDLANAIERHEHFIEGGLDGELARSRLRRALRDAMVDLARVRADAVTEAELDHLQETLGTDPTAVSAAARRLLG